jgi:hypothetical protein
VNTPFIQRQLKAHEELKERINKRSNLKPIIITVNENRKNQVISTTRKIHLRLL